MSSTETPPANHDNVPASDAQPISVEQRLAALEKKAPSNNETRFLRFGAIAGVLGTIISIVNGGLTVYSGTVRQSYEDKQTILHKFEGYIQQLVADNQKITVIASSSVPQSEKLAQIYAANQNKYTSGIAAEQLLPRIFDLATSPELALLAQEEARNGNFRAARLHISRAISLSTGLTRAEMLRFQGAVLATSGDPADISVVLAGYSEAFDIMKKDGNYWGASLAKAAIINDWIIVEAYWVDCKKANDLLTRYVELLSNQDVTVEVRQYYKKSFHEALSQQTRCQLDLEKLSVNGRYWHAIGDS